MNNFGEDLITVDELCEWLMIGKTIAYRLLNSGEIQAFKISRTWKIPRSCVLDFMNRRAGIEIYKPK